MHNVIHSMSRQRPMAKSRYKRKRTHCGQWTIYGSLRSPHCGANRAVKQLSSCRRTPSHSDHSSPEPDVAAATSVLYGGAIQRLIPVQVQDVPAARTARGALIAQ